MKLPRSVQYSIISNQHLVINSEDQLLDVVNYIFERNNGKGIQKEDEEFNYITFLEIDFTSLTEQKLSEFLNTFNFNRMTNALWSKFYLCFFKRSF
mgnify:CR=1 FL=1